MESTVAAPIAVYQTYQVYAASGHPNFKKPIGKRMIRNLAQHSHSMKTKSFLASSTQAPIVLPPEGLATSH